MSTDAVARGPAERHLGIDVGRYALMPCVIAIHLMQYVPDESRGLWTLVGMSACQAAVPMFFVAAGYFLRADRGDLEDAISRPFGRLMPVFLFWLVAYQALAMIIGQWRWPGLGGLAMGGVAYHLWFLPALGFALALNGALPMLVGRRATLGVVLLLALFGLMRGPYGAILGLVPEESRGGTLSAPLLVALGCMLARRAQRWGRSSALLLLAAFFLLQIGENAMLDHLLDVPLWQTRPFSLASFGLGVSAFLVARSIDARHIPSAIGDAARVTLGVYAVHLMLLWLVVAVLGRPSGMLALAVDSVVILMLATLVAVGLHRIAWLRRVVC